MNDIEIVQVPAGSGMSLAAVYLTMQLKKRGVAINSDMSISREFIYLDEEMTKKEGKKRLKKLKAKEIKDD